MGVDASELRRLAADFRAVKVRTDAERAVRTAARDIESAAKSLAPTRTGALRGSISSDIDGLTAEVGPTEFYGVFVEEGTSKMAPQPFLDPATDRALPRFYADLERIAGGVL